MKISKRRIINLVLIFLCCMIQFTTIDATVYNPFEFIDSEQELFVSNGFLYGLKEKESIDRLLVRFRHKAFITADRNLIGTGTILSNTVYGYVRGTIEVVVFGDVNGDSRVNGVDYLKIKKGMSTEGYLQGVYYLAADLNCDGEVNASDYLKVKKHAAGTYNIFDNVPESIRPTPTPEPTPSMTPTLVVNNQVVTDVEGIRFVDSGVRWVDLPFFSICEVLGAEVVDVLEDEIEEFIVITLNGYETTFYNNGSYIDIEIEELHWMTREDFQYDSTLDDYIVDDYFICEYLSQVGYEIEFDFNTSTVTINSIA